MEYVQTTVVRLRALFGSQASGILSKPVTVVDFVQAEDDWQAYAVVLHGTFEGWCMGCMPHEYHVGNHMWVLVLKDHRGHAYFGTDEAYDITQLGKPQEVRLPLADWPTPVALD